MDKGFKDQETRIVLLLAVAAAAALKRSQGFKILS
jgi:hypothetical protein